jgi:hypothetical protein
METGFVPNPSQTQNRGRKPQQKKAGRPTRAGKHSAKIQNYFLNTRPLRKLRRILRNNTEAEARLWAQKNGAESVLNKLLATNEIRLCLQRRKNRQGRT